MKCKHNLEYGQEAGDFEKNIVRVRCTKCKYKSVSISKSRRVKKR